MRGAQRPGERYRPNGRIIPAYAGSTLGAARRKDGPEDHPRVCGEHLGNKVGSDGLEGSSPRMRGAQGVIVPTIQGMRIIPAYAGSTTGSPRTACAAPDHPRVCGEHQRQDQGMTPAEGSSPRMRGAPPDGRVLHDAAGIIPAYAGSTEVRCTSTSPHGDHPRVCGEHRRVAPTVIPRLGSSPRMRGARDHCVVGP